MNEVFLMGRVISKIDFKFIINSKEKSVAKFKIETLDKTIVRIEAFDKNADYVFSNNIKDICINGILKEGMEVIAVQIIRL